MRYKIEWAAKSEWHIFEETDDYEYAFNLFINYSDKNRDLKFRIIEQDGSIVEHTDNYSDGIWQDTEAYREALRIVDESIFLDEFSESLVNRLIAYLAGYWLCRMSEGHKVDHPDTNLLRIKTDRIEYILMSPDGFPSTYARNIDVNLVWYHVPDFISDFKDALLLCQKKNVTIDIGYDGEVFVEFIEDGIRQVGCKASDMNIPLAICRAWVEYISKNKE